MGVGRRTNRSARAAYVDGARASVPILVGVAPFGLIFGVTAAELPVSNLLGWASSPIMFGGAAQLAAIDLIAGGAAPAVVILTALVINARHLMYSASIETHLHDLSTSDRFLLPYALTDQTYALSIFRFDGQELERSYRKWYFLGVGATMWVTWQSTTAFGVLVGDVIPAAWRLDFAVPLVFLALLVPAVRNRPGLAAAVAAAAIAVLGRGLPYNLGLIFGATVGIVVGTVLDGGRHDV